MKKIFIPLFLILSFFVSVPALAQEALTITCNSGSACTKSSEFPLFNETNIYPGFTHTQNFYVDNNRKGPCNLTLKATSNSQTPDILSQKILINISGINNDYRLSNYLLSDLLDSSKPYVSLGHVNKNDKNSYLWSVTFDPQADSNYQNLSTNFNVNFNFECDEETTDNSTNTSSSTPASNQGQAICNNSAPAAPTGLYAQTFDNGSVTLHWTQSTSTHDGYLIAYGTSPGNYQYGAPNIGDDDHYTVKGLTPGAQYCFYVRSLNGCMPGERTPEYCVNAGSTVAAANIAPVGFTPNVLGTTTENNPSTNSNSIEKTNDSSSGHVLGSENSACTQHWLPILFLAAFLINLIYIRLFTKDKLIPLIISLAAYLLDNHLLKSRCCFGPGWLCHYYWIGNVLSWLIPIFVLKSKKK